MSIISQFYKRRRVLLIHNPVAGSRRWRRLVGAVAALKALGMDVVVRNSQGPGGAEDLARVALGADDPADVVVAAGGDGTLSEIANAVAGRDLPVSLLPLGTANVYAFEMGMPKRIDDWARMIAFGAPRPVRLGSVGGRHFVAMISAGFDARAVAGVDLEVKRRVGKAAYALSGIPALLRSKEDRMQVTVDGEGYEAGWVIVAKTQAFAGPFRMVPVAGPERPDLGVAIFPVRSGLWRCRDIILAALARGDRIKGAHFVSGREIAISSVRSIPLQMDGDPYGGLPVTVTSGPVIPFIAPDLPDVAKKTQGN